MLHTSEAVKLVKNGAKQIKLEIEQKEYDGESHNVIAELPGKRDEWIVLSAHYDSTSLSHGAYDNMSGCAGLLGIMEQMKEKELNYGLRFMFCGSEERGLLGSKAYVRDHEAELEKIVLNINLDMIGTYMGKFIPCVSAEEKLSHYISYMAAEVFRSHPKQAFIPVIPRRLQTKAFLQFHLLGLQVEMLHQSIAAMI
jgi:Zn-dependent M28 family amino/carboxypeptidase